jgi:hypothetical protein
MTHEGTPRFPQSFSVGLGFANVYGGRRVRPRVCR